MTQCKTSMTTKTGVFTVYDEWISRCEAELKCIKKGQILAPIANRRDANKLLKLFKTNDATCKFSIHYYYPYWIGLDITYTEKKQEKVFSNGEKWNENKHGKIYKNWMKNYTDCPTATFDPSYYDNFPFSIMYGSADCKFTNKYFYICLKPRSKISTNNERVLAGNKTFAEATVGNKTFAEATVQQSNEVFLPYNVAAVSMIAFCVYVAVNAQRKLRKLEKELKQYRDGASGRNEIRIDGRKENVEGK